MEDLVSIENASWPTWQYLLLKREKMASQEIWMRLLHLIRVWQATIMSPLPIFGGKFCNFSQSLWSVSVIIGWLFGCRQTDPRNKTHTKPTAERLFFLVSADHWAVRAITCIERQTVSRYVNFNIFVPFFVAHSGSVLVWNVFAELFALSRLKIWTETVT